jgi:hypothetical protein
VSRPNCGACECETLLGACDGIPSPTIDFGSGGWTDEECDDCDQIAGEYVLNIPLEFLDYCAFAYAEPGDCSTSIFAYLFDDATARE